MRSGWGQRFRESVCRWFGHRLDPVNEVAGVCRRCHHVIPLPDKETTDDEG